MWTDYVSINFQQENLRKMKKRYQFDKIILMKKFCSDKKYL